MLPSPERVAEIRRCIRRRFVLGSVWFFLLTNGAVWLFGNWYPKTIAGLDSCFVAGLPFWRNSLIADLYGVAAFFGL